MALAFKDQTIARQARSYTFFTRSPVPRAVTPHRQGVGGVDAAALGQGLQHRFDEAVAGVAGGAFAVGAEVGQLAAAGWAAPLAPPPRAYRLSSVCACRAGANCWRKGRVRTWLAKCRAAAAPRLKPNRSSCKRFRVLGASFSSCRVNACSSSCKAPCTRWRAWVRLARFACSQVFNVECLYSLSGHNTVQTQRLLDNDADFVTPEDMLAELREDKVGGGLSD